MEGATNEKTIHLIFKTPSLDTGEHHMESVPLFLTLRDLKEQLSCSFPSNPAVERQKLIYGGKILQDQMTLSEVFAQVGYIVMSLSKESSFSIKTIKIEGYLDSSRPPPRDFSAETTTPFCQVRIFFLSSSFSNIRF